MVDRHIQRQSIVFRNDYRESRIHPRDNPSTKNYKWRMMNIEGRKLPEVDAVLSSFFHPEFAILHSVPGSLALAARMETGR